MIIISGATYYSLGGFDEIEIYEFEGKERTVIGQEFVGKHNSRVLDSLMMATKEAVNSNKLQGALTIVYYPNEFEDRDSIKCFVGASFEEIKGIVSIPSKYDYREFKSSKIYKMFITQHPLVRPLPNEIASMLEVRSIEDGNVLQPFNFEIYYDDGSLSIEAWVK
ncbi:MAG: hypothetical protein AB8B73_12090 [Ekhidna sp.]